MLDDYFSIDVGKSELTAMLIMNVIKDCFNAKGKVVGNAKKGFIVICPSTCKLSDDIENDLIDICYNRYNLYIEKQSSDLI